MERLAMNERKKEEVADELVSIGHALKALMRGNRGRSAMVRTYVDDTGEVMLAANLYVGGSNRKLDVQTATIEFRRKL